MARTPTNPKLSGGYSRGSAAPKASKPSTPKAPKAGSAPKFGGFTAPKFGSSGPKMGGGLRSGGGLKGK